MSLLRQQLTSKTGKWDAAELTKCVDYDTDFSVESDGWVPFDSDGDTFRQVGDGMQLDLVAPTEFIRLVEDGTSKILNPERIFSFSCQPFRCRSSL
jgi:hypothetical protein